MEVLPFLLHLITEAPAQRSVKVKYCSCSGDFYEQFQLIEWLSYDFVLICENIAFHSLNGECSKPFERGLCANVAMWHAKQGKWDQSSTDPSPLCEATLAFRNCRAAHQFIQINQHAPAVPFQPTLKSTPGPVWRTFLIYWLASTALDHHALLFISCRNYAVLFLQLLVAAGSCLVASQLKKPEPISVSNVRHGVQSSLKTIPSVLSWDLVSPRLCSCNCQPPPPQPNRPGFYR